MKSLPVFQEAFSKRECKIIRFSTFSKHIIRFSQITSPCSSSI
jgi:hypothetical protein